ncbi:MAG: FAD-dependent oxidoreductase [Thermoguttaceae bacterium]|nr:FAD-dependent oxidoreductase [Thermoguttaceae bacterium]
MSKRGVIAALGVLALAAGAHAQTPVVNESARQIPVAYRVDVVVVGGSTGAVSAAVAAAQSGAKVFLAAPRPYLGEDMTATLRLWLEEGEAPTSALAKAIYHDPVQMRPMIDPNRIACRYEADQPSASRHKDTQPPSRLTDGVYGNAAKDSVEYAGDVNLVLDLLKPQEINGVRVMAYLREGSEGFKVQSVTIFTSDDKKTWQQVAEAKHEPGAEAFGAGGDPCVILSAPLKAKTRYVKLAVKKAADASRILLGEVEVTAPGPAAPKTEERRFPPRPMHIKKTLDDALLAAGVEFLYSCYPSDVLRDASGNPCGIVMANRAGRQAVVAKTIIDATDRGTVARLAGASFRPFPAGMHTFQRVVIGGEPRQAEGMTVREIQPPFRGPYPNRANTSSGVFRIFEYTLRLPMKDDSFGSWAAADQKARAMTYHPEQQFTSDVLFTVPPDPVHGIETAAEGQAVGSLPLGAFRPKGVARLYVLSGAADVTRAQAGTLLRPVFLIDLGARIGAAAAAEAKKLPVPSGVKLPGQEAPAPASPGDVRESLVGVRPVQSLPAVPQDSRSLPVLGRYDVVVIGGGTAGAPAGIGAARQGARTLVVEYLSGLGGVGTTGAISSYYWGNRSGFTKEVAGGATTWIIERKCEWYRGELEKAGADVWFGGIGCGALVDGSHVTGAVVATPQGRGVVLAKVVIDATGNADIAAPAGAACVYTDHTEFAMQGTGLPPRQLGASYTNTDFTIVDETDMVDLWHVFLKAKDKYPSAFDQGQLVDTRERRRIDGDFTMSLLDQMNGRTYPDTVVRAYSNFDSHGYTVDPYLMLEHPEHKGVYVNVPYRCLLPKNLEGLLVGGIGMSVHRDALPLVRMQPDIQNQGYAAGVAAAMAVKNGVPPRRIDVRALQKHLVEIGNLPESVLSDKDSYPLPPEKIADAVKRFGAAEGQGAAVVLAHPQEALPLVKEAYRAADGKAKLAYAKLLAVLGDATGLETLVAEVERTPGWDTGWNYRGMGQFGSAMSPLDNLLVILGRTRKPEAVPAIVAKLKLLKAESEFSHHRAAALALELIGHPSAARPLAEHLAKPGMTGFAHTTLDRSRKLDAGGDTNSVVTRRDSLRELLVARALYRCGDYEGRGKKILQEYTQDLRGHLARHAQAVLNEPRKTGSPNP